MDATSLILALTVLAAAPQTAPADPRLVFCCNADNDLYRVMAASGVEYPRYETAEQAIDAAPSGSGVLTLADGYPQKTTPIDLALFDRAAKRKLRLYVEYPASLPNMEVGQARRTRLERAVVASDVFGEALPKMRLLAIHDCHFVQTQAAEPYLVLAKVAGYDTAAYGLGGTTPFPILFEHPRGDVMVSTTKLSQFVTARYAPKDAWQTIWRTVLDWLQPGREISVLDWTPTVRPTYSRDAELPDDAVGKAIVRGIDWHTKANMLIGESWKNKYDEHRRTGVVHPRNPIGPAPDPAWPAGDGQYAVLEGVSSTIYYNDTQPVRWWRRTDSIGESSLAFALRSKIDGDGRSATIATNLLDWVYFNSGLFQKDAGLGNFGRPLELIETGGTFGPKNLAAASAGAVPFSLNDYGEHHTVDKLNDGKYGNPSTWIGGAEGSFAGVRFQHKCTIAAIAFGRDNAGRFADRCLGRYCIQHTRAENAGAGTPDEQWKTIATLDYAASMPPEPARRHLYRFPPLLATAVRIVMARDDQAAKHELGIDELEVYGPSEALAKKPAKSWKPAFTKPLHPLPPWKSPIEKQGYLGSPLVEVTPLPFQGKLYLLECWRSKWKWPEQPSDTATSRSEMWMALLPEGPGHYDKRKYVSRVMRDHTLGTAMIWDDRVYVFAVTAQSSTGGQEVRMTWSDDMEKWSDPVKVLDSPKGRIFNVAVTRDEQGMVFLWETNGYGRPFTMCCGRVKAPTDPWNPGIIEGARYGMDKYTGGPALYYEGGWYYTLYLEALGGGRYETRITRSKDLKAWQDAPVNRPFVTFDPQRTGLPLRPAKVTERNASDAELCYFDGKTIVYFTGSDQQVGGDLQWATYDGSPARLFASFFED